MRPPLPIERQPWLLWTAVAAWLAWGSAAMVWNVTGDDLTPLALLFVVAPVALALGLVLGWIGALTAWRGSAPPWLAGAILAAGLVAWVNAEPLWSWLGARKLLAENAREWRAAVAALEAGREPARAYGWELVERGPPAVVLFHLGAWHAFLHDPNGRRAAGCSHLTGPWFACRAMTGVDDLRPARGR